MVTLWRLTPLSSSKVLTEGLGSRRRLAGLSQGEGRPRGLNKRERLETSARHHGKRKVPTRSWISGQMCQFLDKLKGGVNLAVVAKAFCGGRT